MRTGLTVSGSWPNRELMSMVLPVPTSPQITAKPFLGWMKIEKGRQDLLGSPPRKRNRWSSVFSEGDPEKPK
jgi:hypothetical protein